MSPVDAVREFSDFPLETTVQPALDVAAAYRQHAKLVWRVLRHLGIPPAATEDAVHDVFVVVSRRADQHEPGTPVRPWLVGIARRVAMDHRKISGRRRRRHEAFRSHLAGELDDGGLERAEAAEAVRQLLASLPEAKRLVMVLSDLEGWTAPEISKALRMPVNTVYTRLASARKQLEALAEARERR